jgi:hypothetical protein
LAHLRSELRARLPAEVRERARKRTEAMLAELERDRCIDENSGSGAIAGVSDVQGSVDDVQQ